MPKGYPDWTKPVGVELQAVTLDANVVSGLINVARGIIFNKPSAPLGWLPLKLYITSYTVHCLHPVVLKPDKQYEYVTFTPSQNAVWQESGYWTFELTNHGIDKLGGDMLVQIHRKYYLDNYRDGDEYRWKLGIVLKATVDGVLSTIDSFETVEHVFSPSASGSGYSHEAYEVYKRKVDVTSIDEDGKIVLEIHTWFYEDQNGHVTFYPMETYVYLDATAEDSILILPVYFKHLEAQET